jgi:Cysteine-rich CWC
MEGGGMSETASSRQTICERCGAAFGCNLDGPCWCGEEPVRMPLPKPGESQFSDCLCRSCLRDLATENGLDRADFSGVRRTTP